jgi:ornithine--oxo-acid transaminase
MRPLPNAAPHHSPRLTSTDYIALNDEFAAANYAPLDVVITRGEGAWLWDVEGRKYLDLLAAYSAVNFGHSHPRIIERGIDQLRRLTMTSRSFHHDQLGPLSEELAAFCGLDKVLLMNSGAEAVETAIKAARRWGYEVKNIPQNAAEIIVFANNFHGRTTTIISMSDAESSRLNFGPYTPGFVLVPYGDIAALEAAITPNTAAILFEPIQGEGGIIIPPEGFLQGIRKLCDRHNVLMLADEIQTGLCRTGRRFACDHEGVIPDAYIIGKSLGGGVVPISALVGKAAVMDRFVPGSHGSTFGGNAFACAIAREVLAIMHDERPDLRSAELGEFFAEGLRSMNSPHITEIRARGLFIGVDIRPSSGKAKEFCHRLKDRGILCKDTRVCTIRFAPPIVIEKNDLEWALEQISDIFGAR